jgi:NADH-quinone oxidoreductase subunit M
MSFPLLSLLVLAPAIAGALLLILRASQATARAAALIITMVVALGGGGMAVTTVSTSGFHFVERYDWLRAIGWEYHLAADGISLVFLLLTVVVFLMSLLASRQFPAADGRYYGLMLLFQSGLLGTFTAQNFLHFFLFWELSLVPAFFLLRNYGGPQRALAATQFFIYTMVGSIAMLVAFAALYLATGTFDLAELAQLQAQANFGELLRQRMPWTTLSGERLGIIVFLLAFAGVAVKVPIWPLHSWQPLAYVEAPAPVTMVLTGIMSKMGVYALIRLIFPLFPSEIHALHRPLLALAVITILYGAFAAFAQRDIKRLFAYSSLSHLGYCFLGIFAASKSAAVPGMIDDRAAALNGVILQVLSHGIIAAALFAFVSFLEQRNQGGRSIEAFGGLRTINPHFAGLMGIVLFASLGMPGLSGFPAEFLIFKGSFALAPVATSIAVLGLLLTAVYILNFFGKIFHGPLREGQASSIDLTSWEKLIVLPAIAGVFLMGIAPQFVIRLFNGPVSGLVQQLGI